MLTPAAIVAKLSPVDAPTVSVEADVVTLVYPLAAHGARVSADVEALRTLGGQPLVASAQTEARDVATVTLAYGPKLPK